MKDLEVGRHPSNEDILAEIKHLEKLVDNADMSREMIASYFNKEILILTKQIQELSGRREKN